MIAWKRSTMGLKLIKSFNILSSLWRRNKSSHTLQNTFTYYCYYRRVTLCYYRRNPTSPINTDTRQKITRVQIRKVNDEVYSFVASFFIMKTISPTRAKTVSRVTSKRPLNNHYGLQVNCYYSVIIHWHKDNLLLRTSNAIIITLSHVKMYFHPS